VTSPYRERLERDEDGLGLCFAPRGVLEVIAVSWGVAPDPDESDGELRRRLIDFLRKPESV
jgi:hypothetical protein